VQELTLLNSTDVGGELKKIVRSVLNHLFCEDLRGNLCLTCSQQEPEKISLKIGFQATYQLIIGNSLQLIFNTHIYV
jgi:hypothetical protein